MVIDLLHGTLFAIDVFLIGILFFGHKQVRKALRTNNGTPLTPTSETFQRLLDNLQEADIDSKMKIIQAILGNKVAFGIAHTKSNASITYAMVDGYDGIEMMKQDRSVG